MGPINLYYDFRDLFRAPRLALSGKKLWIFIVGNLGGFISYWIFSYLALSLSNIPLQEALNKYGLYPSLFGNEASWLAWTLYYLGITAWVVFILLSSTAVSRVTLKQLKGNDFFSSGDAWEYVNKHWHAVVFSPIAIMIIIFFFVLFASLFALLGTIPYVGELLFVIPYIIYFFGSVFTIYTLFVLAVSLIYAPSIVGVYEEDTMGTVFNSYSITIGHAWRIILYHLLLIPLLLLGLEIISWFWMNSINFINFVFGCEWFMGGNLTSISSYASSLVYPGWLQETVSFLKSDIVGLFGLNYNVPNLFSNSYAVTSGGISNFESISGVILGVSYFLIGLSIVSYGLSILSVGETLMFVIFKKKSDEDDILSRKDEDEIEEDIDDEFTFDQDMNNSQDEESLPSPLEHDPVQEEEE